jgi:excisionase family DNA binding protein
MPTIRKTAEPLDGPKWLSEYLQVQLRTVYSWRARGVGPPVYVVGRHLRYRRSEVDAWLRQRHDKAS